MTSGRRWTPTQPATAGRALRAGVIVLVMLLAGCDGSVNVPASLRTATVTGVVDEAVQLPNGHWEYRLKNGQTLDVDYDQTTSLLGGPQVGRLLLAGTDPDRRYWVVGVSIGAPGLPEGCFFLPSKGRADGDWILTTTGFRLPKASDFTDARDSDGNEFGSDRGGFCLNEDGEVTRYEP